MNSAIITSWLLTYLVHSTILLGSAWLISRILADRRLALQEVLLRTALIGGLLTATAQVGLGFEPIGGALAIDGFSVSETVAVSHGATTDAASDDIVPSHTSINRAQAEALWPAALLSLWCIGSLLATLVLGRSILDLRRLLKTRRFRPAGRLLDRLAIAMGLRRPVRLSTSAAIAVPFATGIRRPEICCPERVSDLASEHQKSLFAHELAHLARRDPSWQLLYRLGEAILFLQPLNRLVRCRLEEIAEHLTDERAVACTGDRLGLARCLVVVAHWGVANTPGVPATAFAAGPRLDRRVRHLISGTIGRPLNSRWTAPFLVASFVASAIFLPAISATTVHADISLDDSKRLPTKTWSAAAEAPPNVPDPALPAAVAPDPEAAPAAEPVTVPEVATVSPMAPAPLVPPVSIAVSASDVAPVSEAPPVIEAVPASPATSDPPRLEGPPAPPASDEDTNRQRARTREEARARQRETQGERSEAEARARQRARATEEEARARAIEARQQAREAAGKARLADAEREMLRGEARELRRQAEIEAREHARMARERMRLIDAEREKLRNEASELARQAEIEGRERARSARERAHLTDAERDALRRRAEALHAAARRQAREASREARTQARQLAEQARKLAEEAEKERLAEENRRRQEKPE
jgi:beta-lactamase regulating signal transducer with metallopeptidase domain